MAAVRVNRNDDWIVAANTALTLELFLKCLCGLENIKYRKVHKVGQLFALLPPKMKTEFSRQWKIDVSDAALLGEFDGRDFVSLQSALKKSDKAYVKFRYIFEIGSYDAVWTVGHLIPIVKARIFQIRPEWEAF